MEYKPYVPKIADMMDLQYFQSEGNNEKVKEISERMRQQEIYALETKIAINNEENEILKDKIQRISGEFYKEASVVVFKGKSIEYKTESEVFWEKIEKMEDQQFELDIKIAEQRKEMENGKA